LQKARSDTTVALCPREIMLSRLACLGQHSARKIKLFYLLENQFP